MAEPAQVRAPVEGADPSEEVQKFHLFSKLPPELRIKIWEAACLPRTSTGHGIHYVFVNRVSESEEDEDYVTCDPNLDGYDDEFDIENDETTYVTLQALKPERPEPRGHASSYLYDAGQWAACKESRVAIYEYLDVKRWETLQESGLRDMLEPGWYSKGEFPSTLKPSKNETWRPISLPKSLYSMKLLAPFMGTRRFTIVEDWNIAFKFRDTWNHKFPKDVEVLKQEKSPRGFLANWFERFHDEILPEPTLYVIDDTGSWVEPSGWMPTVYRDCDNEYVEVPWNASSQSTRTNIAGAAGVFIDQMEDLLQDDFPYDFEDMDSPYEWQPLVQNKIRLLVRKENMIVE
ncbi:hypothetical protein FIE12Z_10847 [Fusarium flagelliforme]|uniref:2EXR domain-containing protein n=1 Tax=Fusarium flagelliforme TaxID=2675880 RepID=A0A395MAH3_9HYPO|nr:hypothetical protein FIE12Z_10847 [Fusarium flagelliforme]